MGTDRATFAARAQTGAAGERPAGDLRDRAHAEDRYRWRDCPAGFGAYTTVFNRWSRQGLWLQILETLTGHSGVFDGAAIDATHIKAHSSAAGAKGEPFAQAIGQSRGGRTTKLHGLVDENGRPRVLLLSAGNINDISMAETLIQAGGPFRELLADKGYDADHLRQRLAERGTEAVIPSIASRKAPIAYDKLAYRDRNRVERLWCRLKELASPPFESAASPPAMTSSPASSSPQPTPTGSNESRP